MSADVLPGLRWSAVDLAEALGQSYAPTPEQAEVIEAGDVKLDINPMSALVSTLSGITSADALSKVQIKEKDGSQRL